MGAADPPAMEVAARRARGVPTAARAGIGVAALLLLPFAVGDFWAYQLGLLYLYAIAALGIGLCWGRAGFLPLGQGLFFGLAAYLSGSALIAFDQSWWLLVLIPLAACASGLLAFVIGILVFRRRGESGPYFSMITLALSLLAFQVANNWESVTGGFNGLKGIPGLPGLDSYTAAYYVAAVALIGATLGTGWLYRAPLGVLWAALAHNERRAAMFGFDTNRLKAVAFGASGLLAGLGGALYAPQQGLVTPQLCGFGLSADLVIWAAVGGRGRLLGPVLGAILIGALTSGLRDRFQFWEIGIAILFIVVVLLVPEGLVGVFVPLERWWGRRAHRAPALPAPERLTATRAARLEIADVVVQLGEVRILDRLSLAFEQPGVYCVIGPNGAGKTSTFNMRRFRRRRRPSPTLRFAKVSFAGSRCTSRSLPRGRRGTQSSSWSALGGPSSFCAPLVSAIRIPLRRGGAAARRRRRARRCRACRPGYAASVAPGAAASPSSAAHARSSPSAGGTLRSGRGCRPR